MLHPWASRPLGPQPIKAFRVAPLSQLLRSRGQALVHSDKIEKDPWPFLDPVDQLSRQTIFGFTLASICGSSFGLISAPLGMWFRDSYCLI